MKALWRMSLILFCIVAFTTGQPGNAQDDELIMHLAERMPQVELLIVTRFDTDFLDQLDQLSLAVTSAMSSDGPTDLRSALEALLLGSGGDAGPLPCTNNTPSETNGAADVMPNIPLSPISLLEGYLGDFLAVGINGLENLLNGDNACEIHIIAPLEAPGLTQFLLPVIGLVGPDTEETQVDDFHVYRTSSFPSAVAYNDALLYITIGSTDFEPAPTNALAERYTFQNSISELPRDDYKILGYMDTGDIARAMVQNTFDQDLLQAIGIPAEALAGMAFGWAIVEDMTLLADVVQVRQINALPPYAAVNPAFVNHIPSSASAFLQSTNMNTLFNTLSAILASFSVNADPESVKQQVIDAARSVFDIDMDADFLSWATTDYALFGNISTEAITALQSEELSEISHFLDYALLIETADPEAAREFAESLVEVVKVILSDQRQLEVETIELSIQCGEQIRASEPTILRYLDRDTGENIDLAIGANQEIFYLGTLEMVESALSCSDKVTQTPEFQRATPFFLPQSAVLTYVTANGLHELLEFAAMRLPQRSGIRDDIPVWLSSGSISVAETNNNSLLLRLMTALAE